MNRLNYDEPEFKVIITASQDILTLSDGSNDDTWRTTPVPIVG